MIEDGKWYNFAPTSKFLLNELAHPQPNLYRSWALKSNMEEKVVDICRYRTTKIPHIGKTTELVQMMRMPPFRGVLIMSNWPWSPHKGGTTHFVWPWNTVESTKKSRRVLLVWRRSGHSSLGLRGVGGNGWIDIIHSSVQLDGAEKLCNNQSCPILHIRDWSKISKRPQERRTRATTMSCKPPPWSYEEVRILHVFVCSAFYCHMSSENNGQ